MKLSSVHNRKPITFILLVSLFLSITLAKEEEKGTSISDFEVVNSYWLDSPEFTEGLEYDPDHHRLMESVGLTGQSLIRTYKLNDEEKEVQHITDLYTNDAKEFGEGLTKFNGKYYQLTYQEGIINIFTEENPDQEGNKLKLEAKAAIPRDEDCKVPEGWGLTSDDNYLYMTDGSDRIFRFQPEDLRDFSETEFKRDYSVHKCEDNLKFKKTYHITHPETEKPLDQLNELELVGNYIYSNIWFTNDVVKIKVDGDTMSSVKVYNFDVLEEIVWDNLEKAGVDNTCNTIDEFNGIAFIKDEEVFLLTGKHWPMVFKVKLNNDDLKVSI